MESRNDSSIPTLLRCSSDSDGSFSDSRGLLGWAEAPFEDTEDDGELRLGSEPAIPPQESDPPPLPTGDVASEGVNSLLGKPAERQRTI